MGSTSSTAGDRILDPMELPKRERSLRACTRCRQRKQRCDNALPNCGNCVKGKVPCEAFPINVVSRENLLHLYDQLQETNRKNRRLQEELRMVKGALPQPLTIITVGLIRRITLDIRQHSEAAGVNKDTQGTEECRSATLPDAYRLRLDTMYLGLEGAFPQLTALASPEDTDYETSNQEPQSEELEAKEILRVLDFISMAFPVISIPVQSFLAGVNLGAGTVSRVELHETKARSPPVWGVLQLLAGYGLESHFEEKCIGHSTLLTKAKKLVTTIFEADSVTRITSMLLLAAMALADCRPEDLGRIDMVTVTFAWIWKPASSSSCPVTDQEQGILQACHWIHLQTALLNQKEALTWAELADFTNQGKSRLEITPGLLQTGLATLCHRQKFLEFDLYQEFLTQFLSEQRGHTSWAEPQCESAWRLLKEVKKLAEILEHEIERERTTSSNVDRCHQTFLRLKILTQIYGAFPRMLHLAVASDDIRFRWLGITTPMAVCALRLYHVCWVQFGWLGDCKLDAHTFVELLCSFSWMTKWGDKHFVPLPDMVSAAHVAIEVAQKTSKRWAMAHSSLQRAISDLCHFRDGQINGSASQWPSLGSQATPSPDDWNGLVPLFDVHAQPFPYPAGQEVASGWQQHRGWQQFQVPVTTEADNHPTSTAGPLDSMMYNSSLVAFAPMTCPGPTVWNGAPENTSLATDMAQVQNLQSTPHDFRGPLPQYNTQSRPYFLYTDPQQEHEQEQTQTREQEQEQVANGVASKL